MADGGGRHDRASTSPLDGAFLLQLLQRPPQSRTSSAPLAPPPTRPLPQEGLNPHRDPAVAAVGPSYSFPPHRFLHPQPPPPPPSAPSAPIPQGFSPGPWLQPPAFHTGAFPFFHGGDFNAPGNLPPGPRPSAPAPTSGGIPRDLRLQQQQDGVSASNSWRNKSNSWSAGEDRGLVNARSGARKSPAGGAVGGMDGNSSSVSRGFVHEPKARAGRPHDRNQNSVERPGMMGRGRPPGPTYRVKASAEWVATNARREESLNVVNRLENRASPEVRVVQGVSPGLQRSSADSHVKLQNGLSFGSFELSARSNKDFVEGPHVQDNQDDSSEEEVDEIEVFEAEVEVRRGACGEEDALAEKMMDNLMVNGGISCKTVLKRVKTSRPKESRFDSHRGHRISGLRVRFRRRRMECRYGIERFTPYFMSIYQSLVPAEEEKVKQKQLLLFLEKLVNKQWPKAQLHVYGSCANSFGVTNSDIDVCLAIDDSELSKPEILLKLADILQSDNLQNVQALTHARVPIVKLMDPVTGISCDICINNLLAVVNTKLLRDYALIDERLQQLAFVVKHWAKSRRINETYRGTLSSYAYVLLCIHFLQQRQPAILPCLQQMETTYVITVDDMECAYFDRVEKLHNFGAHNKESLAHLLWAFFHYWAYCHDYTNDVISVRTGRIMSKRAKDWTRRIGNDRHLICIEDPFEIHHDLGRVVDKHSIKILREEFERAADIMQFDPNPSITLFEPYVPPASPENQVLPELEV